MGLAGLVLTVCFGSNSRHLELKTSFFPSHTYSEQYGWVTWSVHALPLGHLLLSLLQAVKEKLIFMSKSQLKHTQSLL